MKRSLDPYRSSLPPTKFPRRPGSDDVGRDYEVKITALLSLRCATLKDTSDMWIGSNVDQVGDFDDIVLYRQDATGTRVVYMLQLKHQENPKTIARHEFTFSAKSKEGKRRKWKEDFSLAKYSAGFAELRNRISIPAEDEFEVIKEIRKADARVFAIFTNKGVSEGCEFLQKVPAEFDLGLGILNTSSTMDHVYKFDHSKLDHDPEFLQQLVLLTNQVHFNSVDRLITKEIKRLTGLTNVDFKEVTNKFVAFVKKWIKDGGEDAERDSLKIYDTLTKSDIISKLTETILEPYCLNLAKEPFLFYHCTSKNMWNDLVRDKTITLVDSGDDILKFLKEFVASEVKHYLQDQFSNSWGEELPGKILESFYKGCNGFKSTMLKTVGCFGIPTLIDIYRCLWFTYKLPLLLEICKKDDFGNIRKALRLSRYKLRVVLINKISDPLNISDIPRHFVNLRNLSGDDRTKVVRHTAQMQGRSSFVLEGIVDKSMHEFVKCADVIRILCSEFNVGNRYEPLGHTYINRSLSKVLFDSNVLKQVEGDTFLIQNVEKSALDRFDLASLDPLNVIFVQDEDPRHMEKLRVEKQVVHRLSIIEDNLLEWKETYGSTRCIQEHQLVDPQILSKRWKGGKYAWNFPQDMEHLWVPFEDVVQGDMLLTTRVINASPGMGKSVLLDFIAQWAPAHLWVLRVNLSEHYRYFDEIKRKKNSPTALEHLDYFGKTVLKKHGCTNVRLAEAIFAKLVSWKKVLMLLDGFDEVAISYKGEVTGIATSLNAEGYAVWVTTRPIMKLHLEEKLNVISNTLRPFSIDDQREFLTKYLVYAGADVASNGKNSAEITDEFVEKLLEAARANLTTLDCQFTGIPLQTKLLADVFSSAFRASLSSGLVAFRGKFDLLYLYQEFISQKNNILCNKLGMGARDMQVLFERHQQLFALKTVFYKEDLAFLNLDEQLSEYYEDPQHKIQFLQREGIVVVEHDLAGAVHQFSVNFVHRTFAEYLAAIWLSKHFNSNDEWMRDNVRWLIKVRFEQLHDFLFNVFDRIIANGCPLHLAIINGRAEEVEKVLKTDPESVNAVDAGGRVALHLAALHGARHRDVRYYIYNKIDDVPDDMVNIVTMFPDSPEMVVKDGVLGYSALDYAVASQSLAVANKLCDRTPTLQLKMYTTEKEMVLAHCALFNYRQLFKVVLPYFAARDLLLKEVESDMSIESYCDLESEIPSNGNLLVYASDFGVETVLELFQVRGVNSYRYDDLRFASAFGTEDNVLTLLSEGAAVGQEDVDGNVVLHYAIIHGRLDIVRLLTSKGAEINAPGKNGNTALHWAAEKGYEEIAGELLLKGANVNQENNEDDTPLYVALLYNNIEIVELLLSKGADATLQNDEGNTALHIAASSGFLNIVSQLLLNPANLSSIHAQNEFKQTPLHSVVSTFDYTFDSELENRKAIICLLLESSVDTNKQDANGDTVLHYASRDHTVMQPENSVSIRKYYKAIVQMLLEKGIHTDLRNNDGKTALDEAIKDKNVDVVALLQQKLRTGNTSEEPVEAHAT